MSDASLQSASLASVAASESTGGRSSVFYGWWIVMISATGLFFGVPLTVYSFSVFLKPLMQEFHAGRAVISLAYTLKLMTGAAVAPLVGWLIDRYGSRKIILLGTTLYGLTLLANRFVFGSIWQLYLFYILLGLTLHGSGPIAYGNVVTHWFDRRRGLALGVMMLGIGLGALVIPTLVQQLIVHWGWHTAYSILGGAVLLIPIPIVAAFLKEKPEHLGLQLDGLSIPNVRMRRDPTSLGLSAAEAWQTGTFWLMLAAFALVSASVQGCLIHMSVMLTDRGLTAQLAALGSSLMGGAVLLGRVGTGYLLDRLFAPRVAAFFFAGSALGIALLCWSGATPLAFVAAVLVGLGLGAEVDIIAYLTSRYFGLRAFGAIYSSIFAAFAVAGALGPLFMGAGFDRTGSYRGSLSVFLVATLFASLVMTRLGAYRFGAGQPTDSVDLPQPVAE